MGLFGVMWWCGACQDVHTAVNSVPAGLEHLGLVLFHVDQQVSELQQVVIRARQIFEPKAPNHNRELPQVIVV